MLTHSIHASPKLIQYEAKKAKKAAKGDVVIAKSNIILDVKVGALAGVVKSLFKLNFVISLHKHQNQSLSFFLSFLSYSISFSLPFIFMRSHHSILSISITT